MTEVSQTQKDNTVESTCTKHPDQANSQGQKVDWRSPRAGRGDGQLMSNRDRVSVWLRDTVNVNKVTESYTRNG